MRKIGSILVCVDCFGAIAGLDFESEEQEKKVIASIEAFEKREQCTLETGSDDNDEGFSWRECECCGSRLGGARHEAIMLSDSLVPANEVAEIESRLAQALDDLKAADERIESLKDALTDALETLEELERDRAHDTIDALWLDQRTDDVISAGRVALGTE
jgi:hypothetical protein